MDITGSLNDALRRAGQTEPNRRAVIALIRGIDTRRRGGNIDDWHPEETQLSSRATLEIYRQLLREFRAGRMPKAHAVMVYRDGRFVSVMLGITNRTEAGGYLKEATDVVRSRSAYP
ncbi:hypothetical protein [Paraburkholderia aspalathi]|uniref:hypothetical protein n=1 Tax=Paraburkholderia aspalathi TaxID=1324617 RepID=UPI0038BA6548